MFTRFLSINATTVDIVLLVSRKREELEENRLQNRDPLLNPTCIIYHHVVPSELSYIQYPGIYY